MKIVRLKIPYDEVIYFFLSLVPWIYKLNHPANELRCWCTGKSLVLKRDNWGAHLLCCRCFRLWIMPNNGMPYQKSDFTKHCKKAKTRWAHA